MPDDSNSVGVIKYVGDALADSDLKVGTKVYYGNQRQTITIDGVTILVMEETNIVARVEDVASEQKASA
jgi:co-chaperonin GroES (HSP10)